MLSKLNTWISSFQRSTSSGKFIPFVDGLRFLAILPVVVQHASERLLKYNQQVQVQAWEADAHFLVSRGAIGVIIFFTLSGFILSLPFAGEKKAFSYRKYIGRRLTRLEPPFIFWMSLFALILIARGELPFAELASRWLASIFYSHTAIYGEFSVINPVAWSLEVEIQYYLIAPFMALLYFNQPDKRFRRAALGIIVLLFLGYQHALGWHLFPLKASLLGHLQHFLIGMLLADVYKNETAWIKQKSIVYDILAPVSLLVMAYTWTEEFAKTIIMNLALTGLFISAFKGKYFIQFLSLKWITIIGGMCYTIYLIHLPMLELLYSFIGTFGQSTSWSGQLSITLLIALPLILLSSMIGYKMIEQPFMRRSPKLLGRLLSSFKTSGNSLKRQEV